MASPTTSFGVLLRQLRKRAGMTQGDLAAAVGYSVSFVSDLEQNRRLPAVAVVLQQFIPALGLQEETTFAAQLVELAALARGERPPATITVQRTQQLTVTETFTLQASRLPIPPTTLLGREQAVKMLCNRLQGHAGRLLTLVGPPGVGKTRLGLEVATRMQALYQHGANFVALAAISEPDLVVATLMAALGVTETSSKPPQVRLVEFLRHKELLLVLDNFEQIAVAAPLLAELLTTCPRLHVLVTSRERLHLRAEQRFQVPPLAIGPAIDLFVQRAQAIDTSFIFTPDNQPIIVEICRLLDCLPLAIELLAVRIDLFSPEMMLARLHDHRLDLLTDGQRDLPIQHRTLRNAIHRSYVLLNAREQALFRTLGVFVGGFDLAVIGYLGFEEAELQALAHKNLVNVVAHHQGKQRFLLLETLREYALEQLALASEIKTVQRTYALYYFELGKKFARMLEEADVENVLEIERTVEQEVDNLRTVLRWVVIYEPILELPFLNYMFPILHSGRYVNEGYRWIEAALSRIKPEPTLEYATFLHTLVLMRLRQGNLGEAQTYAGEGLALFRQLQHPFGQVLVLNLLGHIWLACGDYPTAHQVIEEGVTIARTVGKPALLAFTLNELWEILIELGDQATAHIVLQEMVSLWRSLDDPFCQAQMLRVLAMDAFLQGDLNLARTKAEEALQLNQHINESWSVALSLGLLGRILWCQGDKVRAAALLDERLIMVRKFGLPVFLSASLLLSGLIAQENGELFRAQALLTECITVAQENNFLQHKGSQAFAAYLIAGLAGQVKSSERAVSLLSAAYQLLQTAYGVVHFVVEQTHYERILTTLRAQLNETTFQAAWIEGQVMTADQAVAFALAQFVERQQVTSPALL